jgi:hypothetical protein
MQLVAGEEPHRSGTPDELIRDSEFLHERKGRVIGAADEVVEALDGGAVEVEVAGHASWLGSGFNEVNLMTILEGSIGCSQTHRSGSDNDNSGHPVIS